MKCREYFEGYLNAGNISIIDYRKSLGVSQYDHKRFLNILETVACKGNRVARDIINKYDAKLKERSKMRNRVFKQEDGKFKKYATDMKDKVYVAVVYELMDYIKSGNPDGTPFTVLDFMVSPFGHLNIQKLCATSTKILSKEDHDLFVKVFSTGAYMPGRPSALFSTCNLEESKSSLLLDGELHEITDEERDTVLAKMDELELPRSSALYRETFNRMYTKTANIISVRK